MASCFGGLRYSASVPFYYGRIEYQSADAFTLYDEIGNEFVTVYSYSKDQFMPNLLLLSEENVAKLYSVVQILENSQDRKMKILLINAHQGWFTLMEMLNKFINPE